MPYTCFLSYARGDAVDAYLQKFADDLRREISVKAGISLDEALFQDTESESIGSEWKAELKQAVSSARVMICICTPRYLASARCGREYKVFLDRRAQTQTNQPGQSVDVIVPVIWSPVKALPELVSQFVYSPKSALKEYTTEGLRHISMLSVFRDDYIRILNELANAVINAIELRLDTAEGLPDDFDVLLNAFDTGVENDPQQQRGPNNAHFVYFAADKSEIEPVRKMRDAYGASGWDWAPFGKKIGVVAQKIAADREFRYSELRVTSDLISKMEGAEKNNEVVVFLVDAWTTKLAKFSAILADYDKRNFMNSAVLVAWDQDDEPARVNLLGSLKDVFRRKIRQCPAHHHWDGICSQERLEEILETVLSTIQMSIIDFGIVQRRAESESLEANAKSLGITLNEKPTLWGPSA